MLSSGYPGEMADCYLDDDGGPEVAAIEAATGDCKPQALCVRVGPVFFQDGEAREPGIWVEYQEAWMASPLCGPVLLTPEVWRELNKAVERRLKKRKKMHREGKSRRVCMDCGRKLRFTLSAFCRKCRRSDRKKDRARRKMIRKRPR